MKKRNKPNQNSAHQVQRTCDHTKATQQAIHRRKLKEKTKKKPYKTWWKALSRNPKRTTLKPTKTAATNCQMLVMTPKTYA